jgi:hypothetical protein
VLPLPVPPLGGVLEVPAPDTWMADEPPFEVTFTLPVKVPAAVGLNCTTIVWFEPAVRLNEAPDTMLNGLVVDTVPVSVAPPVFVTTSELTDDPPVATDPKFIVVGVTYKAAGVVGDVPVAVKIVEAAPPFEVKVTLPLKPPAAVGLNRTTTVWLVPPARLNDAPETTLNGANVVAVPVSVPPPAFVTTSELFADAPTLTGPKLTVVGATDKMAGEEGGDVPVPVTAAEVTPPVEVKVTLPVNVRAAAGLNCTTTVWLAPPARLNDTPETTLNGVMADAVPVSVPPPVFVTVNELFADPPTATDPKFTVVGVMERAGGDTGDVPVPVTAAEIVPPFDVNVTLPVTVPAAVGPNRTPTVWLAPPARLKDPPVTTLNGAVVDAVPVSVPPPVFVTVNELLTDPPVTTDPKFRVVGVTDKVGVVVTGGMGVRLRHLT